MQCGVVNVCFHFSIVGHNSNIKQNSTKRRNSDKIIQTIILTCPPDKTQKKTNTPTVPVPHPIKLFTMVYYLKHIAHKKKNKPVKSTRTTICRYFVSVFAYYLRSINSKSTTIAEQ